MKSLGLRAQFDGGDYGVCETLDLIQLSCRDIIAAKDHGRRSPKLEYRRTSHRF